jgi:hypothetical protein
MAAVEGKDSEEIVHANIGLDVVFVGDAAVCPHDIVSDVLPEPDGTGSKYIHLVKDWAEDVDKHDKYKEMVMAMSPMDIPVTDVDPVQGEFKIAQGKGVRKKKSTDKSTVLQIGASNVKAMENIRGNDVNRKIDDKSKQLVRSGIKSPANLIADNGHGRNNVFAVSYRYLKFRNSV